jgi:beta-phosphoglucomutase-like phosphatase (HAD superfamily)
VEDSPAGLAAAAEVGLSTLAIAHSRPAGKLKMADAVEEKLQGVTPERLDRLFG